MSFFEEENYPEGFKTESFKDFRRAVRQAFDDFAIGFKTMLVVVNSAWGLKTDIKLTIRRRIISDRLANPSPYYANRSI
jgi:hypothetical protein